MTGIKKNIIDKFLSLIVLITSLSIIVLFYFHNTTNAQKQRVFKIDIERLLQGTINQNLKNEKPDESIKLEAKYRLKRLEEILKDISKNERAVIINKKAVLAGALDITDIVEDMLKEGEYES